MKEQETEKSKSTLDLQGKFTDIKVTFLKLVLFNSLVYMEETINYDQYSSIIEKALNTHIEELDLIIKSDTSIGIIYQAIDMKQYLKDFWENTIKAIEY